MSITTGFESWLETKSSATGLSAEKPGFAWEPVYDRLFALGWPHLRLPVDVHDDDLDPAAGAKLAVDGSMEGHYFVRWPRQVAQRYVRSFGQRGAGAHTTREEVVARAVANEAAPISEDEARAMLADRVRRGGPTGRWFTDHFVLLLEAMVGTEVVLDAITTALEGEVGSGEEVMELCFLLGFLLLRVDAQTAAAQRKRLEAVLQRVSADEYPRDGLACAIGGAAAARAVAMNPVYYHHAADDPSAVVAAVEAGRWLPSARHVFLGGERVLELVAPHWKRTKEEELQRKLALQLAPIRSPIAVRILAEMGGKAKAKVKKALPAICQPFAAHLLPELERLTGDAKAGPGATKLIAALEKTN